MANQMTCPLFFFILISFDSSFFLHLAGIQNHKHLPTVSVMSCRWAGKNPLIKSLDDIISIILIVSLKLGNFSNLFTLLFCIKIIRTAHTQSKCFSCCAAYYFWIVINSSVYGFSSNLFVIIVIFFFFRINTIGGSETRMEVNTRANAPWIFIISTGQACSQKRNLWCKKSATSTRRRWIQYADGDGSQP